MFYQCYSLISMSVLSLLLSISIGKLFFGKCKFNYHQCVICCYDAIAQQLQQPNNKQRFVNVVIQSPCHVDSQNFDYSALSPSCLKSKTTSKVSLKPTSRINLGRQVFATGVWSNKGKMQKQVAMIPIENNRPCQLY